MSQEVVSPGARRAFDCRGHSQAEQVRRLNAVLFLIARLDVESRHLQRLQGATKPDGEEVRAQWAVVDALASRVLDETRRGVCP